MSGTPSPLPLRERLALATTRDADSDDIVTPVNGVVGRAVDAVAVAAAATDSDDVADPSGMIRKLSRSSDYWTTPFSPTGRRLSSTSRPLDATDAGAAATAAAAPARASPHSYSPSPGVPSPHVPYSAASPNAPALVNHSPVTVTVAPHHLGHAAVPSSKVFGVAQPAPITQAAAASGAPRLFGRGGIPVAAAMPVATAASAVAVLTRTSHPLASSTAQQHSMSKTGDATPTTVSMLDPSAVSAVASSASAHSGGGVWRPGVASTAPAGRVFHRPPPLAIPSTLTPSAAAVVSSAVARNTATAVAAITRGAPPTHVRTPTITPPIQPILVAAYSPPPTTQDTSSGPMIVTEIPGSFPVLSPSPNGPKAPFFGRDTMAAIPGLFHPRVGGAGATAAASASVAPTVSPPGSASSHASHHPLDQTTVSSFNAPAFAPTGVPSLLTGPAYKHQPPTIATSNVVGHRPLLGTIDIAAAAAVSAANLETKRKEQAEAASRAQAELEKEKEASDERARELTEQIRNELKESVVTDSGVKRHIESRKRLMSARDTDQKHIRRRIDTGPFTTKSEAIRTLISYHVVAQRSDGEAVTIPADAEFSKFATSLVDRSRRVTNMFRSTLVRDAVSSQTSLASAVLDKCLTDGLSVSMRDDRERLRGAVRRAEAEAAAAAAAPSMPMHLMSQPPFPDPHQHGIPNPGRDSIFGGSSLVGAGGVDTDDLLSSGMDVFDDDDFDACLNSLS
eukprot:m.325180 g.325180  ORF g.325180 m.325180 type:complete len:735 (-) comp27645_c1_seq4:2779-4983(-)